MTEPDPTMAWIERATELGQRGERSAARIMLAEIWSHIGEELGDALHQCAIAHAMADVQDDVREELVWDLRALAAAGRITDERAARAGVPSPAAAFFPSLHLNVAECYRKLGELDRAREHLRLGRAAEPALDDDGYGRMVTGGLDGLEERLG